VPSNSSLREVASVVHAAWLIYWQLYLLCKSIRKDARFIVHFGWEFMLSRKVIFQISMLLGMSPAGIRCLASLQPNGDHYITPSDDEYERDEGIYQAIAEWSGKRKLSVT
jgi:hypothetical protein